MKIGLSTYSLSYAIQANELDVLQAIEWIKENGGEHVEVVPIGFDLVENPDLIVQIREKVAELGMDISNYAIGANFLSDNEENYKNEIERVKMHVDIANRLGSKYMRHDVGFRPALDISISQFEQDLPELVQACQQIADYAAQFNITTNVENHGFYIQASDRVQRLVDKVNRPNFKTILDIGNFMCVDENPVISTKKNLPYTSVIHLKDFYYRSEDNNPGEGWFQTAGSNYLRGAIVGHGDVDIRSVLKTIKESGYDGYISIEFEGMEECKRGSKIGMDNLKRIWDEC